MSDLKDNQLQYDSEIAHDQDHERWSRRLFLRSLGLTGAGALLFGQMPVTALSASPLAWLLSGLETDRILVLIRLKGGNDGVNMVIPVYDYGFYKTKRPGIAIPQNQVWSLSPELGMPNTMNPLQRLWQDGDMKVVHSVGYPEQNLSHFRSSDIWSSASDANTLDESGWLGRWLDGNYPDYLTNPPANPPAIQIGGFGNLAFNNDENVSLSVIVSRPEDLAELAKNGQLYDPNNVPECYYGEQLSYLRTVSNSTFRYASVISAAYNKGKNAVEYAGNLGQQLAMVARLIKGGLGTRLYMVTLDGFDNHANQNNTHPALLNELAAAVRHFYDDLNSGGWADKVLAMTISEFGRRIEQNASNGTDHGAAAPMLLFGPGLNGNGFAGKTPNLREVDAVGNLAFQIDFRQVYASVLENWLCLSTTEVNQVLGRPFSRLPQLGLSCAATPVVERSAPQPLPLRASFREGQLTLFYNLPLAAEVDVQLFSLDGRMVWQQAAGRQAAGEQVYSLGNLARLPAGAYVARVQAGRYAGSVKLIR